MSDTPQIPEDYALGEWLEGTGPEADIAVCTRVRFARNVEGFRFSTRMTDEEATELNRFLSERIGEVTKGWRDDHGFQNIDLSELDRLEREVLMERHLISRDHALAQKSRSVVIDRAESVSIMINEEDHLRSQVFRSGFQVAETYSTALRLDEELLRAIPLAFSEQFGFLTACPTNTGTGLRISVMLHLPGLVWSKEIENATHTAQKIHLAVRGLYGEGSRAIGDFYQVSNQVTLGRSETQILADVGAAVARLVEWERNVRGALLSGERRVQTLDRVCRALGTLERARILSSEECLNSLSAIRFGVHQGLFAGRRKDADALGTHLNRILLLSQPAHLQRLCKRTLDAGERDQRRAALVRGILATAGIGPARDD